MERLDGTHPANAVIVGCGRLGSLLAGELSRMGSRVMIIDRNSSSFELLDVGFSGFRVIGDAVEVEVLLAADLQQADCLLTTTEKDTVNLMVAQVAKILFSVPLVLARVYDPKREVLYREFGIETISPTSLTADAFLRALCPKRGLS
ncbi:MAG: potassium transporter TrkA [Desulfobulbaceae bacterium DB1]|nr:MAG: potassium transporter TrkA [Desulfobulbaceae bacterium DB1]